MYPQIFGKYVLERELASGGMAQVFVATLRGAGGFEKKLAVKQIRPELASDARFVERFIQEAKTAVELTHPNIVPVYELGVEGGVYYIAMELCRGLTLAELLAAEGLLGFEAGAYVGVEIGRALDYAHRRAGIVHRDVTPRNVLIDDEGAVRLIDFGIARPVAAGAVEVFGSPGHMPPEQVRGERLGPATDVFALGALVIEACTGEAPFRRATERESLLAVGEPPEPPSRTQAWLADLDAVLLAAVEPDAEKRLQSIDALGRALREALRDADLGDVARELGRCVRRVRRASLSEHRPLVTPPALPSAGSATRTFATRPLEEARPNTRRLRSDDPAGAGVLATRPLEPPSEARAEGPATRPLLTPEPHETLLAQAEPSGRGRGRTLALGLVLCGGLALAWWGGAGFAEERAAQPHDPRSARAEQVAPQETGEPQAMLPHPARPAPPRASPAGGSAPSARVEAAPGSQAGSAPKAPAGLPATAAEATAPRSDGASEARAATVMLTAAPPAQVTIGGQRLATPVSRLELPAGEYQATFTSPTWDGPISARVQLERGGARHVHADFTSEPPRVIVR